MLKKIGRLFKSCDHHASCGHDWHLREELLSAITHFIAAGMALAGLVILVISAIDYQSWHALVGGVVYCIGLIVALGLSAIYHGVNDSIRLKERLRIIDHIGVFFLIFRLLKELLIMVGNLERMPH